GKVARAQVERVGLLVHRAGRVLERARLGVAFEEDLELLRVAEVAVEAEAEGPDPAQPVAAAGDIREEQPGGPVLAEQAVREEAVDRFVERGAAALAGDHPEGLEGHDLEGRVEDADARGLADLAVYR